METFYGVGFTAKTLSTILLDECNRLYDGKPGDDTTVCTVRIRKREPMNLLFGPPSNRDDCDKMMSLFFSKEGKHIVCGGTTSSIAARYLGKTVRTELNFVDPDIPPIAHIDGVDLVTEGVITINRVLEYAKDYLKDNEAYKDWSYKQDGASMICRLLFEEATDINFFVGRRNESGASESGASHQFQYQNAACERAFGMPEEDGKTDQGQLFLRELSWRKEGFGCEKI